MSIFKSTTSYKRNKTSESLTLPGDVTRQLQSRFDAFGENLSSNISGTISDNSEVEHFTAANGSIQSVKTFINEDGTKSSMFSTGKSVNSNIKADDAKVDKIVEQNAEILNPEDSSLNTLDLNNDNASSNSTQDDYPIRRAWDPRLMRTDSYAVKQDEEGTTYPIIVPFASNTASSAFFDMVFTLPAGNQEADDSNNTTTSSSNSSVADGQGTSTKAVTNPADRGTSKNDNSDVKKIVHYKSGKAQANEADIASIQKDTRFYGVASLVNPYSVTKLIGALEGNSVNVAPNESWKPRYNHFYDIRDQRRFYDVTVADSVGTLTPSESNNPLDINNPTTTNIITWSNKDIWGRTPYAFQDFVFCKFWNIVPNNRMITLRKYPYPCIDNLNFEGMLDKDVANSNTTFPPIATMVTYFGDECSNKLSDILKFSTGVNWHELEAKMWDVNGSEGGSDVESADKVLKQGGLGDIFEGGSQGLFGKLTASLGGGLNKVNSFGKFLGIMDSKNGYGTENATAEKLFDANLADPYNNGPYFNRIIGPINVINKVQQRQQGIKWTHDGLSLTFEYVSRPIGGVNTKAALLDILANCLQMGSANAMFWGGGHKFEVKPHSYPWGEGGVNRTGILKNLYKGKIFGNDGAIDSAMSGIKSLGTTTSNGSGGGSVGGGGGGGGGSTGSFSFETLLSNIGNSFGGVLSAIGSTISSAIGNLFPGLGNILNAGTNAATAGIAGLTGGNQSTMQQQGNNLKQNISSFWKNKMIQNTIYPNITGMRAILIGVPVGNWHVTIGNPLNPIAVIGNLVCDDMNVTFSDELGPDDFPLEMKVTFKMLHGMARDRAGIESMFNRGGGKIYDLPDYIQASSDMETKVDAYTGGVGNDDFRVPKFISAAANFKLQQGQGRSKSYSISPPKKLSNAGDPNTTIVAKFSPVSVEDEIGVLKGTYNFFENHESSITVFRAHNQARKTMK